jgi:hypothetical protein
MEIGLGLSMGHCIAPQGVFDDHTTGAGECAWYVIETVFGYD